MSIHIAARREPSTTAVDETRGPSQGSAKAPSDSPDGTSAQPAYCLRQLAHVRRSQLDT